MITTIKNIINSGINVTTATAQQTKKGRKILLTIIAIPVAIILLSTALYFMVDTKVVDLGTVNNGTLITPPLRFSELPLQTVAGQASVYGGAESKWSYVVFGDSQCLEGCERMLYLTRQTHIALAKKMPRVQRLYVSVDGAISESLHSEIQQHYADSVVATVDEAALRTMFANSAIDPLQKNSFFVVDHNGWLMMVYQADDLQQQTLNDLGKLVLKDMRRLLK